MCTYNGARYVAEQLNSIGKQTRPPDELVVCDDRSSDDTVRIVEQFKACAGFPVRIEVNSSNLGSTKNFEKAIFLCQGDLIALADQDDVWLPHKLEIIEREFQRRPAAGLVFSDAEVVDKDMHSLGYRLWMTVGFNEELRSRWRPDIAFDLLLGGCTVTGATMAFRSRFRDIALTIPDDLPMIHDGWIAAIIAAVAELSFIEEPLIKYRQHEQQQLGTRMNDVPGQSERTIKNFWQQLREPDRHTVLMANGERVLGRLRDCSDSFDCCKTIRVLEARLHHMRVRERMPRAKLMRVPQVVRELSTRRYHRYSNGLYSAIKDIVS
jgi:glycosyltransferase involved in cell wall biosynthesis